MRRRDVLKAGAGLAAGVVLSPRVARAAWPDQNITLVVPFPPGGTNDILARAITDRLGVVLGKPVILDNRGGAAGAIGSAYAARQKGDGYTLMIGHIGTLAVNSALNSKLPYNPLTDFTYVAPLSLVANVFAVHPSVPAKTIAELIAYAKANPGKLNYSTAGNGSAAHIAMAAFIVATGIDMVHIPYRGTAPSVTDLLAGQVQMSFTGATALLQHVRAGSLRALGVSTLKALPTAPEIPPVADTLPGFEASQWYGVVAPAGLPNDIRDRLYVEIRKIMETPEVAARLETEGALSWDISADAFRKHVEAEIPRWKKVVEAAHIQTE